jgi:hypothetical protein
MRHEFRSELPKSLTGNPLRKFALIIERFFSRQARKVLNLDLNLSLNLDLP